MKYYVVIPAHNEQDFLKGTLRSLVTQKLLPKKVIIVNDNSTDSTEAIIDTFSSEYPFITKLNTLSSTEHMPGSKVINAFTKGLHLLDDDYDFIVKLDADLILPSNYFSEIATVFKTNNTAGVVGGFVYEKNKLGEWQLNHPMHKKHVRGAFKAYSKACFKAIGGLKNAMGWDTVDELLAQYHGFDIITLEGLNVKHLRPTGNAYNKKAKQLQGKAMYRMHYGFIITCIASLKMAFKQQKLNAFFDNIRGYLNAKKQKTPFLVAPEEGKFIRNLRWQGIKKQLF
ncbi:glycosyltransferase family 2 protein [Cellulophaga sp. L1A9]|uniref:glycosyltransferase family 2 protein n=1 Tax=Cellulophaga sp. L1A9 TaxID=2686362 RepID=UPI00131E8452|nr:glycosyltransferase family 2 protein [Cellulophaga sp. L1A9]